MSSEELKRSQRSIRKHLVAGLAVVLLTRPRERVLVNAEVLDGQLVDVRIRVVSGDLDDTAADVGDTPGLAWVVNVDGDARIASDVPDLLMRGHRVDQDVLSVGVQPHLGEVRGTVRHKGRNLAERRLLQQLLDTARHALDRVVRRTQGGEPGRRDGVKPPRQPVANGRSPGQRPAERAEARMIRLTSVLHDIPP